MEVKLTLGPGETAIKKGSLGEILEVHSHASVQERKRVDNMCDRLLELGDSPNGYRIVIINPVSYASIRKIGRDRQEIVQDSSLLRIGLLGKLFEQSEQDPNDPVELDMPMRQIWVGCNKVVPDHEAWCVRIMGDPWEAVEL